jgi:hypothetical protein
MPQNDESIRNTCIEAIRRKTIKRPSYPLSTIYEKEDMAAIEKKLAVATNSEANELPIALVYIDGNNWTVATTQRIISNIDSDRREASAKSISKYSWKDFKGYRANPFIRGTLTLADNKTLDIFIETGAPSMIMIYAVMTLTDLYRSTEPEAEQAPA